MVTTTPDLPPSAHSNTGTPPSLESALAYQEYILELVSRTFALTIPQLPRDLYIAVANAYLLCRIADTIEDDASWNATEKIQHQQAFIEVIADKRDATLFGQTTAPMLAPETLAAERDLIANTGRVIQVTRSLDPVQQAALFQCVQVMSRGMNRYQNNVSAEGLAEQRDLDFYCYYVAGVVGEMLTDLFCHHDPNIASQRDELMQLAPSFGQALQMTNILKDVWDDRSRGVCWWPQATFQKHGVSLVHMEDEHQSTEYQQALNVMIGITHGHIQNALRYTLMLPSQQGGIRKFCLWALGLAILTLKNIHQSPHFRSGQEVKVSRRRVKLVIFLSKIFGRSNKMLMWLFRKAGKHLPITQVNSFEWPMPNYHSNNDSKHDGKSATAANNAAMHA